MLFLFFLIIDLCFLIPALNAHIFNSTTELVIPTGIPANEANGKIEAQPLTGETKINGQSNSNSYMSIYAFYSSNFFFLFILKDNFLFHLFF